MLVVTAITVTQIVTPPENFLGPIHIHAFLLPVPSFSWMHAGAPAVPLAQGTHDHTNCPFPRTLSTAVRALAVLARPGMMRERLRVMAIGKGIMHPALPLAPDSLPTDKTVADHRVDLVRH